MSKFILDKETEQKRIQDFQRVAENWDKIPEKEQGRMEGIIMTLSTIYGSKKERSMGSEMFKQKRPEL